MTETPILGLLLMATNQSQKEEVFNRAIVALEVMTTGVIDRNMSWEPSTYSSGDSYIVSSSSPSGAFAGRENNVAYYYNGWKFITPDEGMTLWVNSEDLAYTYDGAAWVPSSAANLDDLSDVAITSASTYDLLQHDGTSFVNTKEIDNITRLGIGTTADATNKLSVNTAAILFNNAGSNVQLKLNKNALGDTASVLYQQGFTGYHEFGMIGDLEWALKSYDGSSFNEMFKTDRANNQLNMKGLLNVQPAPHAIIDNNYYFGCFGKAGGVSNELIVDDFLFSNLFFVGQRTTFTRIGIEVVIASATPGATGRLGIYRANQNLLPEALVLDAGTVIIGTIGAKEITISQQLDPGYYHLVYLGDEDCTLRVLVAADQTIGPYGSTASNLRDACRIEQSFSFAALPDPYGTPTFSTGNVPAIWLRKV